MSTQATPVRWQAIWQRLSSKQNRLVRGAASLAGGTVIGQALAIAASPVLTRLYVPEDFGTFAVYAALLGWLSVAAGLKYEVAIALPRRDGTAANVLAVACLWVLGVAALVGLAGLPFGELASNYLNAPNLARYLWLLPVGLVAAGLYRTFNYWAIRVKDYSRIARTKVSQGVGQTATQVLLGLLSAGPLGLMIGAVVGHSAGLGTLARTFVASPAVRERAITWPRIQRVGRRYFKFGFLATLAALVNSAGLHAVPLLFAGFYGPAVAGWMALADRLTSIPVTLIGTSLGQVYFGEIRNHRTSPEKLQGMLLKTSGVLLLIAVVPALVLGLTGGPLFRLAFGAEWYEAGIYAQLLVVWLVAKFVAFPVSQNLNILERQDLSMAWSTMRLALVVASIAVPAALGWSPRWAVASFSVAAGFSYAALLALNLFAIRRHSRRSNTR